MGLKYAIHRTDENAERLYAYAERRGFKVFRIGKPVDALLLKFRFLVACEVKTEKGKLRPGQIAFLAACQGPSRVIRVCEDIDELDRELRADRIRLECP